MARLATALALCAGARAYVAPVAPKAVVARSAFYGGGESGALDNLEGAPPGPVPNVANPGGAWDPLNLAGATWPGNVAPGVSWKSCLGETPLDTWDNLPMYGKYQIIAWVGLMEVAGEMERPHYMTGGKGGTVFFDPPAKKLSLWDPLKSMKNWDEAKRKRGRLVELQNGRAAMFGVIGFVMAYKYPGTVPALKFFPHYEGELPGAPFAGDWHISETASQWAW